MGNVLNSSSSYYEVSSCKFYAQAKKKQQKKNEESNLAHFGHQSNKPAIVVKYDMNETMNRLKKNFLHSN